MIFRFVFVKTHLLTTTLSFIYSLNLQFHLHPDTYATVDTFRDTGKTARRYETIMQTAIDTVCCEYTSSLTSRDVTYVSRLDPLAARHQVCETRGPLFSVKVWAE